MVPGSTARSDTPLPQPRRAADADAGAYEVLAVSSGNAPIAPPNAAHSLVQVAPLPVNEDPWTSKPPVKIAPPTFSHSAEQPATLPEKVEPWTSVVGAYSAPPSASHWPSQPALLPVNAEPVTSTWSND